MENIKTMAHTHELELQISHSLCAEIQAEGVLRGEACRGGKDTPFALRMEEDNDIGGGGGPRPCAHVARNSPEVRDFLRGGFLEGEKPPAVVRAVSRVEIQVSEQGVPVPRPPC